MKNFIPLLDLTAEGGDFETVDGEEGIILEEAILKVLNADRLEGFSTSVRQSIFVSPLKIWIEDLIGKESKDTNNKKRRLTVRSFPGVRNFPFN